MTANFKPDLAFGESHEQKIFKILNMDKSTVEVKTEKFESWTRNGNMCIEVECYGKPSGVYHPAHKKNKVKYWIHNLCDKGNKNYLGSLLLPIKNVEKLAEKYKKKYVMGGDNRASKLILVPLSELFSEKNFN